MKEHLHQLGLTADSVVKLQGIIDYLLSNNGTELPPDEGQPQQQGIAVEVIESAETAEMKELIELMQKPEGRELLQQIGKMDINDVLSRLQQDDSIGRLFEDIHITLNFRDFVNQAKSSLDIISFKIHNVPYVLSKSGRDKVTIGLVGLLNRAIKERDVNVRIITPPPSIIEEEEDKDYHRSFLNLIYNNENISIHFCPGIHIKMIIMDQRKVLFGSSNITATGLSGKNDWMKLSENPREVMKFIEMFNKRWEKRATVCLDCPDRICEKPIEDQL
ncbi:MAG: hypothetical protein GF308_18230 [Candidatus Heimdallarchaeota archaeon]|nr:hypothetical protein [Candidatus Heimdallarchaeota archaeon]